MSPYGRRGFSSNIGERMTPDERAESSRAHERPTEQPKPRAGNVNEHDLYGRALLVVVRSEPGLRQAYREGNDRRADKPGQEPAAECKKAGRVGEVDQSHCKYSCAMEVNPCPAATRPPLQLGLSPR
jgi:hypothetical protein